MLGADFRQDAIQRPARQSGRGKRRQERQNCKESTETHDLI
jgi:hypothetical protein